MFGGVIVDFPTPFQSSGEVDLDQFQYLMKRQLDQPISGLLIGGPTGEGQTLSEKEILLLLQQACQIVSGRFAVLGALYWEDPLNMLDKCRRFQKLGIDAVVLFLPPIAPLSVNHVKRQLYQLRQRFSLPIILAEPVIGLPETLPASDLEMICKESLIVAFASTFHKMVEMAAYHEYCHQHLTLIAITESYLLPALAVGAKGVLSAIANYTASPLAGIIQAYRSGNHQQALQLYQHLLPFLRIAMGIHPAALVKSLLAYHQAIPPYFRLPLKLISETTVKYLVEGTNFQASG